MTETKYGIKKAVTTLPITTLPVRDLLLVPHNGHDLVVAHPAFRSGTYNARVKAMNGPYFHSEALPRVTFRPATTSESVGVSYYGFNEGGEFDAKRDIFDHAWLEAGRIGRSSEGVYANIPVDANGKPIIDEKTLKEYLNNARQVNGIWLVPNREIEGLEDFGFAPYESFKTGIIKSGVFARGGLARVLEHTNRKVAKNLAAISSTDNYPNSVNVWGFEPANKGEVLSRVAALSSDRDVGVDGLSVDGFNWDDSDNGCAFGVSESAEGA